MGARGRKRAVPMNADDVGGGQTELKTSEYEQVREKRIKENQERMEKLGIFDISLKLKSNKSIRKTPQRLTQPSEQPPRRSSRKMGKREATSQGCKRQAKKEDDPNKPKRPPCAFFVFLEEFRKAFNKEHPNVKAVSAVGKAGGEKWKSLSPAEKAAYEAKAAKRKSEYEKLMNAYNNKQAESSDDDGEEEEESERPKSEIHDEDAESGQGEEEEEEDEDEKAKKDPNKPKRPPSAFFVFLEEFRKMFKKEHPNVKAVSAVGKAGGEKWKSLSAAEKAPYEAKAAKRKSEYEKLMNAYNKQAESSDDDGEEEEESERPKSEIHDEDAESGQGEEEEEDEDDEEDEDND